MRLSHVSSPFPAERSKKLVHIHHVDIKTKNKNLKIKTKGNNVTGYPRRVSEGGGSASLVKDGLRDIINHGFSIREAHIMGVVLKSLLYTARS